MMTPETSAVRRPSAATLPPVPAGREFSRCLRQRLPELCRSDGAPTIFPLWPDPPSQTPCTLQTAAAPTVTAPKLELDLLSERLCHACLQVRQQNGPLEIALTDGWLQGASLQVAWNGQTFHCRIRVPAARARLQLRGALSWIASRLQAAGLPLGRLEVQP